MTTEKSSKKAEKTKTRKEAEKKEKVEIPVEEVTNNEMDEKVEKLEAELVTMKDSYQRLAAEYDNFRKRTIREKDGIYVNATSNLIESFLPVMDSMEMAKGSADSNADKGALKKGIEMMYRQFREILEKLDIDVIETVGEEFNPEYHHALEHIEDEKYGENEVVAELVKGYIYKEKVIRHSLVKVAN